MAGTNMKRRLTAGTSLIEVLVVMVVFLVGVLTMIQIFPAGLTSLRTTRDMTFARSWVRSEMQSLVSRKETPGLVVSTTSINGTGFITVEPNLDPNELMPPLDVPATNTGAITNAGIVQVGGNPLDRWDQVSGANRFNRVLGEGRPVPGPRPIAVDSANFVGTQIGSLVQLTYGPIYYDRDGGTEIGTQNWILAYGNDLRNRDGSADAGVPNSTDPRYSSHDAWYMNAAEATSLATTPFPNEDQVWIGRMVDPNTSTLLTHSYRFSVKFYTVIGGNVQSRDVVVSVLPAGPYYAETGNYAVISIPRLLDTLSGGFFALANYRGVEESTLRMQRQYQEIPPSLAFQPGDPYQYKVISDDLGAILVNPEASQYQLPTEDGEKEALLVRCDYSVYDWRIVRDEFTVPDAGIGAQSQYEVKLLFRDIKTGSGTESDGTNARGLGDAATNEMLTPVDAAGTVGSDQFVLVDLQTGGIILGDNPAEPLSTFDVDFSTGVITFRDVDNNAANGLTGQLMLMDPFAPGTWINAGQIPMNGRPVRALYRSNGDYAIQPQVASSEYIVTEVPAPNNLGVGQCYVGGGGWGSPNRIYFPLMDAGHRVVIGDIFTTGNRFTDQSYTISGREQVGGVVLAFVQSPDGLPFDFTRGNAVARVKGASIRVRAIWNPSVWQLGANANDNYERMKTWAQSWRRVESETYQGGAN